MRRPMSKFLAMAGTISGFDLQWGTVAQSQEVHAAPGGSGLSFEEPYFTGFARAKRGSEALAVAKALGIAIGLTVLYVMLRQYGSPIV